VVLNNCKHQPGPKTHIDKYIDMAKCIDCGLSLYYLTPAFEGLMLPGKNRVMQRIEELQRGSDPLTSRGRELRASGPITESNIQDGKQEAKVKMTIEKTVANAVANLPKILPGQSQELPPVPEKPPRGNNRGIRRYYKDNTPLIITDIQQIGLEATRERWKFEKVTWYKFCKKNSINLPRDGYKPRRHNYPKTRKPAVKETVKNKQDSDIHGTWVSFPPFNDKWAPEVQIKWLEVYKDLAMSGALRDEKP
jgi:hypothetical protein